MDENDKLNIKPNWFASTDNANTIHWQKDDAK